MIFSRDLFRFFCESRVICETVKFVKVKMAKFFGCPHAKQTNHISVHPTLYIYIAANGSVSASVPLTANAEAIHEIEVLHKHRHTRPSAVSMNALV